MFNLSKVFLSLFSTEINDTVNTHQSSTNHNFHYFHEQAIVDEPIYPYRSGRVYFQATWWPARCEQEITLVTGDIVYVVGINNITLLVAPNPF